MMWPARGHELVNKVNVVKEGDINNATSSRWGFLSLPLSPASPSATEQRPWDVQTCGQIHLRADGNRP